MSVLGVSADKAFLVVFLPYLILLAWGLLGGAIFLFYTSGAGRTLREEMRELERAE